MRARGQQYVGCFFVKDHVAYAAAEGGDDDAAEADALGEAASGTAQPTQQPLEGEAAADHLHEYGTFAQVHTIHKIDSSPGALLMLMGARPLGLPQRPPVD